MVFEKLSEPSRVWIHERLKSGDWLFRRPSAKCEQIWKQEDFGMVFPSREHFKAMRKQLQATGYDSFTDQQKTEWHAYDYGWRIVYRNDHSGYSPIDEKGERYDPFLAKAAAQIFPLPVRDDETP